MNQIFYIIRHGETDWNVIRKLQGHSDIPLNAEGQNQAQSLSTRIQDVGIQQVISSDLLRARETARLVLPSISASHTPHLREVFLGQAEGKTRDEIINLWGSDFWDLWGSMEPKNLDHRFPQGESKREMLARVIGCLEHWLDQYVTQKCAFFSHGLVMRSLVHRWNPKIDETFYIPNCGVLKIKRTSRGEFEVLEHFDHNQKIIT